ncbi:MAG: heat-inducible transcription repressor HrcA [Clostridia bacterium]|nr:heat-inducible transcription repressor HrcA [Clostridia bacterium]
MQLDDRKMRILKAIVESYIDTGEPVGSKALAEQFGNNVSSATIRNDMTVLVSAGYLEQPHTSAGRLPTAKAFKLYVEQLMQKRPLAPQETQLIDEALAGASGDATRLLEDTCRALADLTGLAAVATRPDEVGSSISRIDILQMSPRNMAVMLALDNGFLRTRMCRCQRDIPSKVAVALADYMCHRFLNKPLDTITVAAMQEIIIELGELGLAVAPILSAFYELVQESADSKAVSAGQLNLLRHPDYELEQARAMMNVLGDRQQLCSTLENTPQDGVRVLCGDDAPTLGSSSLITTRYSLGEIGSGVIGVVGPMRMNYAAIIPLIEYFAQSIGCLLGELFEKSAALDMR